MARLARMAAKTLEARRARGVLSPGCTSCCFSNGHLVLLVLRGGRGLRGISHHQSRLRNYKAWVLRLCRSHLCFRQRTSSALSKLWQCVCSHSRRPAESDVSLPTSRFGQAPACEMPGLRHPQIHSSLLNHGRARASRFPLVPSAKRRKPWLSRSRAAGQSIPNNGARMWLAYGCGSSRDGVQHAPCCRLQVFGSSSIRSCSCGSSSFSSEQNCDKTRCQRLGILGIDLTVRRPQPKTGRWPRRSPSDGQEHEAKAAGCVLSASPRMCLWSRCTLDWTQELLQ